MKKGTIGVTTENIFPIIKKFLYSDHEIFLRELVSNAVDASQKLRTLASFGEFKGEIEPLFVSVKADKENGTLTITDRGVGMTQEEIDKYINQIAFSGAEEFLEKYKNDANTIIGHFGLGFYSSFMVSKEVEIRTLSYKEGAQAVSWRCDGSPEYSIEPIEKNDRGTEIILHIDDDNKEFLEQERIESLLKKYCRFLPIPVHFGKEQEWKDGKYVDTDKDKVINETAPAWTKKPTEMTDQDYQSFYQELFPMSEDPLFWIHLNVDYPFKLTGILYFPKIKNNFDLNKNKIQLYCNQVFVTDNVEGIVPEFLTLLHGVIDSPDIPLNVSRSYLQSDSNVKKISSYITRKVADRMQELFNNDRKGYEEKWDKIKIFIQYGMLSDEKFYERGIKFALLKNTEGQYFTFDEYKQLISSNQTDKNDQLVYLYATDAVAQYSYIQAAKAKGYDVLLMDGQLDNHVVSQLEHKFEKSRFARVDSDVVDHLIAKEEKKEVSLSLDQRDMLSTVFQSQISPVEKSDFMVSFEHLGEQNQPVIITQNEFMRRMKEMSAMQPGMSFYGEMNDNYNLIVNIDHPLSKQIVEKFENLSDEQINDLSKKIEVVNNDIQSLDKAESEEEKAKKKAAEVQLGDLKDQRKKLLSDEAGKEKIVHQIIDLALLSNNLLKGEALNRFITRSTELL